MNPRWLAVSFLAIGTAALGAPQLKPISLDECVRMALEKNLDIRIVRYTPKVAALDLGISYADYYDPKLTARAGQTYNESPGQNLPGQPTFAAAKTWNEDYSTDISGYLPTDTGLHYDISGSLNRNSGTRSFQGLEVDNGFTYSPRATISITQPLLKNLWTDQFRYTIDLNKKTLKGNEQDVVNQALTTMTTIASAYYDLAAARENVVVQRKAVELAQQQYSENKTRVQVGTMAPLDEKQAESQAASARADLLNAEATYATAQRTLKKLITDDFASLVDTILDPSDPLDAVPSLLDRVSSWEKGLNNRPDIVKSKLALDKQKITMRYNHNQLFPQLDLTGSYGTQGRSSSFGDSLGQVGDRDYPNFGIGVVFSYPLSNKSARNRYREAKLQVEQALLQYKQLEQQAMVDIDNNIGVVQSDYERVQATRAATKYAELAYEGEKRKLENGKSTSFVVLQLQKDLTTARSNEIKAVADYNKALFSLYQSEASTLERLRIQFSIH